MEEVRALNNERIFLGEKISSLNSNQRELE